MSRKIFLPRPEVEKLFLTSSPCPRYPRRSVLLFCPVVLGVLRCSISAASSSFSSDDVDRSLKRGKRAGCTLSTMDLSEARGLVLVRVVRGSIGITRRLGATGTPIRLQAIRILTLEPERLKNRLATTRRRSLGMDGLWHPRRSSGLRFQLFNVEAFSLLPQSQRNGCYLARQRQTRHRRLDAFRQRSLVEVLQRS